MDNDVGGGKQKRSPKRSRSVSPFEGVESFSGSAVFADSAVPAPTRYAGPLAAASDGRVTPDFLKDTFGGGELEKVPGYSPQIAMLDGLEGSLSGVPAKAEPGPAPAYPSDVAAKLETVYPTDDRVLVRDTTATPWRAICHLIISRESGVVVTGTGWFAGPDVVVTAGHNYLHHTQGGYASRIRIIPGANGAYAAPFGEIEPYKIVAHQRWIKRADPAFDYALIRLPTKDLGRKTGWFGFADVSTNFLNGAALNLAGYPYDKPRGTLWFQGGRARVVDQHFIAYRLDTEGGQSGSPIFYSQDGRRQVVAMHTQGDPTLNKSKWNSAVRITGTFFDELYAATQ